MATQVPTVVQNTLTHRERTYQFACLLMPDGVGCRGSMFQKLLGHHLQLVDVMDICKVAAKGTSQHSLPTLATLHWAGIPFGCRNLPLMHPTVQFDRELGPYPTRGADHCLRLCSICLKPHPCKKQDINVQRTLKEFCVLQGKVRVVDIKDSKEGCQKLIQLCFLVVAVLHQLPQPLACNSINQDVK